MALFLKKIYNREYNGIIYQVNFIPYQNAYRADFIGVNIPSIYGDNIKELERDIQKIIDEYNKIREGGDL